MRCVLSRAPYTSRNGTGVCDRLIQLADMEGYARRGRAGEDRLLDAHIPAVCPLVEQLHLSPSL